MSLADDIAALARNHEIGNEVIATANNISYALGDIQSKLETMSANAAYVITSQESMTMTNYSFRLANGLEVWQKAYRLNRFATREVRAVLELGQQYVDRLLS